MHEQHFTGVAGQSDASLQVVPAVPIMSYFSLDQSGGPASKMVKNRLALSYKPLTSDLLTWPALRSGLSLTMQTLVLR